MSGEGKNVCFACFKQFHQTSSSSSSVLAGSQLFAKFVRFSRQYLLVTASESHPQDEYDGFCGSCSRRVASICQLHNELKAVEHRLSTKLEELGALMKQQKNENQKEVLCATRNQSVRNLRNEIVLKCFEKRELLMRNRECQDTEKQDENDEVNSLKVDIKPGVKNLQEDSEDGTNLDLDDDEERMENSQNHSFGQLNKIENEEEDEQEEDSNSDNSFIPSPGARDSSDSESDCSDNGKSISPEKDQAKLTIQKQTSTSTETNEGHEHSVDQNVSKWWNPIRPCKHCGVVIEGPRRAHMRIHERERERQKKKGAPVEHLVCQTCGASCVGRDAFRRHMNYYHRGTTWICELCGKTFRMKGDLQKHQSVHTGARDFKCHLCPSQYGERRRLKAHLVKIHGKEEGQEHTPGEGILKRNCEYPSCSASFLSESELTSHIEQIHSNNEEGNVWICKLCGKVFANQQRLTRHDLVHNKVKKHTCTVCNKAFPYLQSLKKHLKVVHLKERLPCTQPGCDLTFGSSSNFYKHLRKTHGIYTAKYKARHDDKLEKDPSHPGSVE